MRHMSYVRMSYATVLVVAVTLSLMGIRIWITMVALTVIGLYLGYLSARLAREDIRHKSEDDAP
jgi:hypothetical protein